MTDEAACEVASVPQRRRRRKLVDTDSDASEASPVQVVHGGRRLVIVGAQTKVDPAEPTVPDQESHRTSDTESIEPRGISDMEGEVEVASVPEPPVPAVVEPIERFNRNFEWLAGVDSAPV